MPKSIKRFVTNFRISLLKKDIMEFFLCVLGMVMIVEGLPYFAFPERMKHWVQKILEMPDGALRKFGCVLMFTGLLLVYIGTI